METVEIRLAYYDYQEESAIGLANSLSPKGYKLEKMDGEVKNVIVIKRELYKKEKKALKTVLHKMVVDKVIAKYLIGTWYK